MERNLYNQLQYNAHVALAVRTIVFTTTLLTTTANLWHVCAPRRHLIEPGEA